LPKNKKIPTIEEFLKFKPKRSDFEWYINEEGLVKIKVPKFKSNIGKSFCRLIKKENIFTANLDNIGSIVWKNCNGKKTVKQILEELKKEFPEEKNIDQRLFLFIQQMKNLNYIDY
jgi:hypothetical protein